MAGAEGMTPLDSEVVDSAVRAMNHRPAGVEWKREQATRILEASGLPAALAAMEERAQRAEARVDVLAEECKRVGLPVSLGSLLQHIRSNHALIVENYRIAAGTADEWQRRAEKAEQTLAGVLSDRLQEARERARLADGLLDKLLRAAQIDGRFDWGEVEEHLRHFPSAPDDARAGIAKVTRGWSS